MDLQLVIRNERLTVVKNGAVSVANRVLTTFRGARP